MDKITIWGGIECVRGDESEDSTQNDKKGSCIVTGTDLKAFDGYHTFDELYDHRITLFIALCSQLSLRRDFGEEIVPGKMVGIQKSYDVWRSKTHSDGNPSYEGWFIMGIGKEKGEQISYHIPLSRWDEACFAETLEKAPPFDGHTSADVLQRLKQL